MSGRRTSSRTAFGPRAKRVLRRTVTERDVDPELRQLRQLKRSLDAGGPDLLIFGDSAMFWTTEHDTDRRSLADMIVEDLDPATSCETLVGAGYNPRIIMAYLEVIAAGPARPRAIVVPASVLMATELFLEHPHFSYRLESEDIRSIAVTGDFGRAGLRHADTSAFEEYDRRPAPSLVGARRTAGEHRLLLNSAPQSRWQTAIRLRAMMDYYVAERLTADSPGVVLVKELGAALRELGVPAVAYVAPANHEVMRTVLGEGVIEHLRANVGHVVDAYTAGAGPSAPVVDAAFDSPSDEFVDPAHVGSVGRSKLAGRIAAELRALR